MQTKLYIVDSFTDHVFAGNPAAVCPLKAWPADEILQKIATENNLSETAFFVQQGERYDLRWFTPTVEIDLCGHATLASAFIIFKFYQPGKNEVCFDTKSGELKVRREGESLIMDFPSRPGKKIDCPQLLEQALGAKPLEVYQARDILAVFENEDQIKKIHPKMQLLTELNALGIIITAPGREVDFVSRAFFPKVGIPEDPVTGSTHCTLIPYWSERLGKRELSARQVSVRGGELSCKDLGDRIEVGGKAVVYLEGEINLPE